ncbi:MAG: sigma-70 family RNA polymerase sigma factor [Alphaproteobacteria bacterium]|nr:sigma-70 family RNA polymerase sigma factor [Alphaproteobacteria bacterium]
MGGESPVPQGEMDTAHRGMERQALLEYLAERYRLPFTRYFMKHVANAAEAEDLVQEVFLRVARRGTVPAVEFAEPFLFRTAVNLLRDRHRRRRVRAGGLEQLAHQQLAVEEVSPERVLIAKENLKVAMEALGQLREQTRDIFLLHRLEKMKHQEIAELYGISVSAVEKHIIKALAHLTKRMRSR